MKRKYIFKWLLSIVPALTLLTGCDKEEIIFESDIPRFEIREDRILIEVLVPSSTPTNDEIYIVGAFNGGEESAVGNLEWQLEMSSDYNYRYGIYLNPSTFVTDTSLGDGFYFYSASQGAERDLKGNEVIHTDDQEVGTRTNITIPRWASYFTSSDNDDEDAITHDGYVIYVIDDSGYETLALYAWGDAEAFGSWPGMTQTGTVTISGQEYVYFDTGADNEGLTLNLIFNNNNNGSQLADFEVTLNRDYYLEVTADGVTEIDTN